MISIKEVDGNEHADLLHSLNALAPECFPLLQQRHLDNGFWFVAYLDGDPIAFAGMVPFDPFPGVMYLKRCYVLPEHRGHGLQGKLLSLRELKARELGRTTLVSECSESNTFSAANFRRAGYELCEPEQPWARDSLYWVKRL